MKKHLLTRKIYYSVDSLSWVSVNPNLVPRDFPQARKKSLGTRLRQPATEQPGPVYDANQTRARDSIKNQHLVSRF